MTLDGEFIHSVTWFPCSVNGMGIIFIHELGGFDEIV